LAACFLWTGCRTQEARVGPTIEFTKVPSAAVGGPDKLETVEGRVVGARPGQRVVLFAKSAQWWVQPTAQQPYTTIRPDSSWTSSIHLGTEYAALLVEPTYVPPVTSDALPGKGGSVLAVVKTNGGGSKIPATATLHFSGYEWEIRQDPSPRGGVSNQYDPANAWTDEKGRLHLRIARTGAGWSCAEVNLRRSLGYGSYLFAVREVSHLEPAAVLAIYTWDDLNADQNHREIDIEVSRWGDSVSKNTQYAIQPYYVPVNMFRFNTPAGVITHSIHWEAGRVLFQSFLGAGLRGAGVAIPGQGAGSRIVAEHTFTSGVPSPGSETARISFYVYGKTRTPLQNESEVVIEKFEYLP
jgi:hypothetical protein